MNHTNHAVELPVATNINEYYLWLPVHHRNSICSFRIGDCIDFLKIYQLRKNVVPDVSLTIIRHQITNLRLHTYLCLLKYIRPNIKCHNVSNTTWYIVVTPSSIDLIQAFPVPVKQYQPPHNESCALSGWTSNLQNLIGWSKMRSSQLSIIHRIWSYYYHCLCNGIFIYAYVIHRE